MKIKFKNVLYIKGRIGWQLLRKDEYLKTGDYYLITGVDIQDNHLINFSQCYYVSKDRYEMDDKIQVHEGDIIVTKDGTIGKIGFIDKLDKPATLNSHLFLIRNLRTDILDSKYLFYILQSDLFKKYATNNTSGSNIPAFTQKNIENFETELPSLDEQRKIAKILGSIDAKINNNLAINDNLQQTIFDIYFKSFANKETNGCISDILLEEEKSKTQVGQVRGKGGKYPFFTSGEDILRSNKYLVNDNHIFLNTGGNPDVKYFYGKCDYSTDTWCIKAKDELTEYLYLILLLIKPFMEIRFFKGTGLKHLQKNLLKQFQIYIPSKEEICTFNEAVQNQFIKISSNYKENITLLDLRSRLLPLLMNGQVSVK